MKNKRPYLTWKNNIILKSFILPKLYDKLSILPIEIHPPFLKRLNASIYGFVWVSKWERISRLDLACSACGDGRS